MIPPDAWPAGDRPEWWDDETRTYHDFVHETTRPYTAAENAEADVRASVQRRARNAEALRSAAHQALAVNRTYLASTTSTSAPTVAQVRELSKQMNAIIRLVVNALDSTD